MEPTADDRRPNVTVRPFRSGDEAAFRLLNEEWIRRYFTLEPKDRATLGDPVSVILEPGGEILIAELDGCAAGCCALIRMNAHTFEVAKMAVTERAQGHGIGRKLMAAVIETARHRGARRLYLETNGELQAAIHLYESFGFRRLDPSALPHSPYTRVNVWMELALADPSSLPASRA